MKIFEQQEFKDRRTQFWNDYCSQCTESILKLTAGRCHAKVRGRVKNDKIILECFDFKRKMQSTINKGETICQLK